MVIHFEIIWHEPFDNEKNILILKCWDFTIFFFWQDLMIPIWTLKSLWTCRSIIRHRIIRIMTLHISKRHLYNWNIYIIFNSHEKVLYMYMYDHEFEKTILKQNNDRKRTIDRPLRAYNLNKDRTGSLIGFLAMVCKNWQWNCVICF